MSELDKSILVDGKLPEDVREKFEAYFKEWIKEFDEESEKRYRSTVPTAESYAIRINCRDD